MGKSTPDSSAPTSVEAQNQSPPRPGERDADAIREQVRKDYARVARASDTGSCCGEATGCCGVSAEVGINTLVSVRLGYSDDDLAAVPAGADMGLGCGNPRAIASLREGEVVVDLGAGGGFDCFLAAREVGSGGRVIGVDMTPDMVAKARRNAAEAGYSNVEFRLGEIEHLPIADASADVIISNCVINLSPDKPQVFREAFRVLKSGGRLAISDVVATAELPEEMKRDPRLHSGCMAGASVVEDLDSMIRAAGFASVRIAPKDESRAFIRDWAPGRGVEDYVVSASIEAVKPEHEAAATT
jgi:SAM-dependent methyltransferase